MPRMIALAIYAACAALVDQLGDDHFVVRQSAQSALEVLAEPALPLLIEGTQSEDVEVRRRCERVVEHYYTLGMALHPWIDSLPKDFPDRDYTITLYLHCVWGGSYRHDWPEGWPDYRYASALLFRDLLGQKGWPRARVLELVKQMQAGDEAQMRRWNANRP
jgi:hypothetical protein